MTEPLRILVVDDDSEFLAYARDGLEGVVVEVAETPLQAIWLLERDEFRAVVCDLVLRDLDGRHLLDVVHKRWPATMRILVTGFGSRLLGSEESPDTFPAAEAVVHKPCDLAALSDLLATGRTSPS